MSRSSAARFGGLSNSWKPVAFAVAALLAITAQSFASSGSGITGRIVSSETGEPLGFANVVYFRTDPAAGAAAGTAQGTISNADGTYKIQADPGTYRLEAHYIGYADMEVTEVQVTEGNYTVIDFPLTTEAIQVETVKITAKALRNTDASILAKRKKAVAVSDGISAEQIKKSTDSNAAEAVNRVTGLSVVGGKYVYVRGLGERYSSAQLNGATVGSPEANRRVLPLDLFPSALLDNVVVQKTYTPDQPAEFGGGSVNVTTLDFPSNETWSFSFKGGANAITTGEDFGTYQGGANDWLGYDDGIRDFPDLVQEIGQDDLIKTSGSIINPGPYTRDEVQAMGQSFNKIWNPEAKTARPIHNFSAVYGNQVSMFGRDLGFVASLSQGNGFNRYDYFERSYIDGNPEVVLKDDLDAVRSVSQSSLGGLVNGAYRLNEANTVRFNANYTRTSHDEVRFREGSIDSDDEIIRETRLRFIQRGLLATSAGMDHTLRWLGNTEVDWRYEYSEAERDVPDLRSYQYELITQGGDSRWQLQGGAAAKQPNRWYESSKDYDRNAKIDMTVPFTQWGGLESKFKVGYASKNKDRRSEQRRFYFAAPQTSNIDLTLPVDQILADENIGGSTAEQKFALTEWTREVDGYTASHEIDAYYAMVDIPLAQRLRLVGGARVEESRQETITVHRLWADVYDPDIGLIEETDVLPSANLTLALGANTNIRAAYSSTLNRPDLRELSAGEWDDSDKNRKFLGNPELSQAELRNFDLRWEYFPSSDELLAVSGFYKDLVTPIEYVTFVATGSNDPLYQPVNASEGYVGGVELEARIGLDRVTSTLNQFGVSGNLTLIDSNAKLPEGVGSQEDGDRPLTGQSEYMVNGSAFWASAGGSWNSALQYNVFGRRIDAIGVLDTPNVWEEPRDSLDFTTTYRWGGASLKFSFENILDSPVRFTQGGQETERRELGRSVSLSVGYGVS
jgi:outer membrane receptor protein involved in Fe transport